MRNFWLPLSVLAALLGTSFLSRGALAGRLDKAKWPLELDALRAAPASHKILLENDRVRVLEVLIPPGMREPVHTHSLPSVMYVDKRSAIKYYDGSGKLVFQTKGSSGTSTEWLEPEGPHSVENIGPDAYHAIRIELKR